MQYTIISIDKTNKTKTDLNYRIDRKIAVAVCKILNALLGSDYSHSVEEVI